MGRLGSLSIRFWIQRHGFFGGSDLEGKCPIPSDCFGTDGGFGNWVLLFGPAFADARFDSLKNPRLLSIPLHVSFLGSSDFSSGYGRVFDRDFPITRTGG